MRLTDGPIGLRPIRSGDARAWREVRARNIGWLAPWEATPPPGGDHGPRGFGAMARMLRAQARAGTCLPFVVTYAESGGDRLVGQLTVSGITYGSARWGQIGYWIDQAYAGRGIIPTAVALATDHCFFVLGLHRLEIHIRPENVASLRVVEKLGFRPEGLRRAYLHINGAWRDHLTFAMCAEDVPEGLLTRWHRSRHRRPDPPSEQHV
ncbi:MAG TPA: GNAT family protein [Actinopolymorphaceae bacterium]